MTWRIYQHPSEDGGNNRAEPDSETQDSVESIAVPDDPAAQLRADLNAAKADAADWQDRFLRKAAEFENYRKRADKEKIDSIALAKSSVLSEFLPIADAYTCGMNPHLTLSIKRTSTVGTGDRERGMASHRSESGAKSGYPLL